MDFSRSNKVRCLLYIFYVDDSDESSKSQRSKPKSKDNVEREEAKDEMPYKVDSTTPAYQYYNSYYDDDLYDDYGRGEAYLKIGSELFLDLISSLPM